MAARYPTQASIRAWMTKRAENATELLR